MTSSTSWPCAALSSAELAGRTTLKVGGWAEWLLEPASPDELVAAWTAALEVGGPVRLLGGGANLILDDGELPGVVISTARLRRSFRMGDRVRGEDPFERDAPADKTHDLEDGEPRLVGWAGASMPGLVRAAAELGWAGLEGLVGVPGSLGGGVRMNAGGRWGDMWDVVETVRCVTREGELVDVERADANPTYRDGGLGDRVVVAAVVKLERSSKHEVRERMKQFLSEKRAAQPVTEASCGCIFKNPDKELSGGRSAGILVEESGAKGLRRGGAVVSELHGNFIVNRGGATAADVLTLIEDVRDRVAQRTGIRLEREVEVWRREEGPSDH
jgi:UDP-N-acetylmuramate dehydrogenase